ncbi:MAG: outer membrane protein assembly factor BamA, partial [Rhodospirillales bacterium]
MIRIIAICLALMIPGGPLAMAQTPSAPSFPSLGADVIQDIAVEGAQRVEPGTVISYMVIKQGDPYDAERIDRSLKSLFATGLFADVSIQRQGKTLVVNVVENPVINRVAFEGNRKVESDVLEAEVTLRPRVIFTRTKVQNDVKRLLAIYRVNGRFAASIEPKVIQLPQNRVDLVFEINEGKPTDVRKIRFVGNREFSDSRLREIIQTRETRWWRFFSSSDRYDPDRLTFDRELLRRFYLKKGFADFRVASAVAELSPNRENFFITFTIAEGARYKFGNIDLAVRLKDVDEKKLEKKLEIKKGDWYDASEIENVITRVTTEVNDSGKPFVDVRPRVNRNRDKREINITFEVNEGAHVFVERIDISGNVRTLDQVIRREFRFVEGDAFNVSKLRRSRKRVQDLDFFQKVKIDQVPGSAPDKTVIKTTVEEKATGSVLIGAGFSTTSGALVDLGLQERNFLGRGQDIKFNITSAEKRNDVDLSFTEPYFLGRQIVAGVD